MFYLPMLSIPELGAIEVHIDHDEDAGVWYVKSSNIPGLSGEASTFDELSIRIPGMILDLFEENGSAEATRPA